MNSISTQLHRIFRPAITSLLVIILSLMSASALSAKGANPQTQNRQEETGARLVGRAVLDTANFAPRPSSEAQLGGAPINGQAAPNGKRKIRSPQHPFTEETSAVRVMNAMRKHAQSQGARKIPVFSPWHLMLDDANPNTFVDNRKAPPAGSGLKPASSEIFNVGAIQRAGYPVVVWTVNDKPRMLELMRLGVNGIISDRPDLLRQAVEEFDANGDGKSGDFINPDGLIEVGRFDAQGHRGGRDLRPENTLPAMEVALDSLMSTLELDTGITSDRVAILDHDSLVQAEKCRRAAGGAYTESNEVLIKAMTAAQLQSTFVCDKLIRGPQQTNDPGLSPVSVAFATSRGLISPYVMPTLQQVFNFVRYYADYYGAGPGSGHPDATRRWKNAERVRFNIETKINPRREFANRTIGPMPFARIVARTIVANQLEDRADIQSFDFRTLMEVHKRFRKIRTVHLFGDSPIFADPSLPGSDEGTNLQDERGRNTPWLAGLYWPYRISASEIPSASQSGHPRKRKKPSGN